MLVACVRCGRPTKPGPTCDACAAASPANERPYDAAAWRRRSREFLRKHPKCALCGKPSDTADHYPHTRKELLAQNVPDPDEEKYLRALCRWCHSRFGRRTMMRFTNDPA